MTLTYLRGTEGTASVADGDNGGFHGVFASSEGRIQLAIHRQRVIIV